MSTYRERFGELVTRFLHGNERQNLLDLLDTFDRRDELFNLLRDDFVAALDALEADYQNQFLRRTAVRTSFATIEGLINSLNYTIVEICNLGFIQLANKEIEDLTEQVRTRKGDFHPKFMSLGNKVCSSFALFARKFGGYEFSVDTTTAEWKRFESAIRVRNQLMHPRVSVDMNLDDEQLSISYRFHLMVS